MIPGKCQSRSGLFSVILRKRDKKRRRAGRPKILFHGNTAAPTKGKQEQPRNYPLSRAAPNRNTMKSKRRCHPSALILALSRAL